MRKPSITASIALAALLLVSLCDAAPRQPEPRPSAHPSPHPSATPTPDPNFGRLHWREVGPAGAGGRVAAVAGSASDPFLYYLGTAGGGVWKSNDGGASWDPVFSKQAVGSIGAVEIDPTNNKTVWAGTGEANPRNNVSYGNGIYKSTNGGDSWRDVGLKNTRNISRIVINPKNPKVVVVAAFGDFFADNPNGGVWRTDDGGRSWQHTLYLGPQTGASDLAIDPKNPNILFAGMWQVRRVPWNLTSGGTADGLYRSMDGGKTWSKLSGHGLPRGLMGRIGLAIAPSNTRRVYALIQSKSGILWRSDDGGDTWRLMTSDTLVNQRPFYFSHLAVDPTNPNHVYAISEFISESKNGGKTFKSIADEIHVDFHAIWIAPNNAKRMLVGEDGGYALSANGGDSWSFSANLVIGQVYHTAFDDSNPYHVCAPLQDNNSFCGPSNSLSPDGILNSMWKIVTGGDGMWAIPDPADPHRVWADSQGGFISIFDDRTNLSRYIAPWYGPSGSGFAIDAQQYRFNWDSPIAFAPWDPHTVWLGGNVIFQTTDDGAHWTVISPDLTRNIKAHQHPSGGPISLDVSPAEYSDNTLDIEGSPLSTGEIWVGTDDGLVQLTRDGGLHWTNVTPRGVPQLARVETVAPSPSRSGVAYAIFDDHRSGNYKPYIYATSDYGATWRKITNGLPQDQYARTVRPDPRIPALLYAGTENGIWISYDEGAHWQSLRLNLPAVSVRDIRIQPTFDDLIIATHGRGIWIFDDLHAIQGLPAAKASGAELFALRPAYEYHEHSDIEDLYTWYAAANPPYGAIVNFYQVRPSKPAPRVQILDATGHGVRTISGTHKVKGKDVPFIANDPSLNRVVWDCRENGPVRWIGAAKDEYRGPKAGALMPPGTYTVRVVLGGRALTQTVEVRPDPRLSFTQADYQTMYDFVHRHFQEFSNVDIALNALDALKKALNATTPLLHKTDSRGPAALAQTEAVSRARDRLFNTLTANFHNEEDGIMRPGALREDLQDFQDISAPPLPPLIAYADSVDQRYREAMRAYNEFAAMVSALNAQLMAAGARTLPVPPKISL